MVATVIARDTDFTPNWPPATAGAPAGSYLIHAITHKGASDGGGDTSGTAPPSGWTLIDRFLGPTFRPSAYIVGAPQATASNTAVVLPGSSSGSSFTVIIPASQAPVTSVAEVHGFGASAAITIPALTAGQTLVAFVATDNNGAIASPAGGPWDTFNQVAQYSGGACITKLYPSGTGSFTLTWAIPNSNFSIFAAVVSPSAPAVPVSVTKIGSPVVVTGEPIGSGIQQTATAESGIAAIKPTSVEVTQQLEITRDDLGTLQNADVPGSLNVDLTFQTRHLQGEAYNARVEIRKANNSLLALGKDVGASLGESTFTGVTNFPLTSTVAADYAAFKVWCKLTLGSTPIDPGDPPPPDPSNLVRTQQPYWWDHLGLDIFDLQARSPGGNFWVADNVAPGQGAGTSANPWNLQSTVDRCDGNQIPFGSRIWLKRGLNYAPLNINGRSGRPNARYTLIAEDRTPRTTGWRGEYPWAVRWTNGASCWQVIGLHGENNAMNAGYLSKINSLPTSGSTNSPDSFMQNTFFPGRPGMNPGILGFQLDGFGTNNIPGNVTFVNVTAPGWGEGIGGYHCGSYAVIGCEAWDGGRFSPNGRSAVSFSRGNTGSNVGTQAEADIYTFNGTGYRGVVFGNYTYLNYQLITSWGIGSPTKLLDGNGIITPTDQGFSSSVANMGRGRHLIQCNISALNGAIGITGFQGSIGGVDCNLNTTYGNSLNIPHASGTSPVGANTTKTAGKVPSSHGEIVWWEFSSVEPAQPFVNLFGNVMVQGGWGGRTLHSENMTVQSGRNFIEGGGPFGVSGTVVGAANSDAMKLAVKSTNPAVFDPSLNADSPALNQAFATDAAIKWDYRGQPIAASGNIDAGAIQRP